MIRSLPGSARAGRIGRVHGSACGRRPGPGTKIPGGRPAPSLSLIHISVNKTGGEAAVVSVRRGGEQVDVSVNPVKTEDGQYKLGAWVRDDTQGIGTVTSVSYTHLRADRDVRHCAQRDRRDPQGRLKGAAL